MTSRSARQVRVDELVANPANIRDDVGDVTELARSIRQHGILQPLTVTEVPQHRGWLVLAGHRRLAGARDAGLNAVPCFIHHDIGTDRIHQTVLMLVENVQRRNLSPMEKARAYGRLQATGLTPTDIARRTGIAVSSVHTHLALLDVDDDTAERIEEGTVTAGDAIAAVREQRQAQRNKAGTPTRGRPVVAEPMHFGPDHPLFVYAAASCDHSARPRVGTTTAGACGQCWESVIRANALNQPMPDPVYDDVIVERFFTTLRNQPTSTGNIPTSVADRAEIVRRWLAEDRALGELAAYVHWNFRAYARSTSQDGAA